MRALKIVLWAAVPLVLTELEQLGRNTVRLPWLPGCTVCNQQATLKQEADVTPLPTRRQTASSFNEWLQKVPVSHTDFTSVCNTHTHTVPSHDSQTQPPSFKTLYFKTKLLKCNTHVTGKWAEAVGITVPSVGFHLLDISEPVKETLEG